MIIRKSFITKKKKKKNAIMLCDDNIKFKSTVPHFYF